MRPMLHFTKSIFGDIPLQGAEIGVDEGYHAFEILHGWHDGLTKLHLIDNRKESEIAVKERLKDFKNYQFYLGDSAKLARSCPDKSLSFVYIDDDHSYEGVTKSLEAWWPKIHLGGVIGGHDYYHEEKDYIEPVAKAVTDFLNAYIPYSSPTSYLHFGDRDWWFVKTIQIIE